MTDDIEREAEAARGEQARRDHRTSECQCAACIPTWPLQAGARLDLPRHPRTRELIATVRAGIGGHRLPSHQEGIEADEALTELEKRIGGE